MSNLLLKISGSRIRNKSIFAHQLFIYDDLMVFKKRGLIRKHEVSISYNHVSQIYLRRGLFYSDLEIINTGGIESIFIRYVLNKPAEMAKKVIDRKIHFAHQRQKGITTVADDRNEVMKLERSLQRLEELLSKGRISKREYNSMRTGLLKEHYD
ncbi:MAG: hypothetical protein UX44_C0012G0013 [candidate division WWE3 bacterium GW2011_GWA1_46_21]|uniref:DUF304 domain-containing protein n=2 Tax=Katanobacteria TaxID=422282 RepID=A0A0G1RLE6_UNCKA|nr:MAG: hypothetical protein UX44_C0012G0013 [candidate division WWE3 bacterium GW2011_GWA1_46_21]KKU50339.1 MAG: hypothetical protein UX73_C0022G0006 [candidate division WWE3 bacterium GW2011_GWC1_47_10]